MSASPDLLATPEEPNAARRRQLINAAIAAIAGHGLSRTTVGRVAKLAGMSAGMVSFHFRGKDELLLATLQSLDAEFDGRMRVALEQAPDDPAARLRAIVDVYLDPVLADPRKVAVWFAFWGESRAREDYLRICGAADRAFAQIVTGLFAALPGIDPTAVEPAASAFIGMLDAHWQSVLFEGEGFDRARAVTLCNAFLDTVGAAGAGDTREPGASVAPPPRDVEQPGREYPTLAPWTYRSPALFDLEMTHLFKRHWLLVDHVSEIPEPGDYLTFDAAGERALIVRGDDGVIRAFHNVCRHRGSCLVEGARGHCERLIVCPFHGWAYGRDGALHGVPAQKTFEGLDKRESGLVALDLEVWQGFVFVRFGGDGPSVATLTRALDDELAPYRLAQVQPLAWRYSEVKPVNWKLIHDVDNEGYHVPIGHPALQTLYGKDYRDTVVNDWVTASYGTVEFDSPHWSVARYQRLLPGFGHLPPERQRVWAYYGLFPNQVLVTYPDMVEFYQTLPLDVGHTVFRGKTFALPDARREMRAVRYLNARINARVGEEDERYFTWLREAMRSSVYPRDRLSSIEAGVANFHRQVKNALPVARREVEPDAATIRNSMA